MVGAEAEESFIYDAYFADDYEILPGGAAIKYKELRNFREQKDFVLCNRDGEDSVVKYNQSVLTAYNYYYEIWENCKKFGLPNGGDWSKNPPWLIDLIKKFNIVFRDIETYRNKKGQLNGNGD